MAAGGFRKSLVPLGDCYSNSFIFTGIAQIARGESVSTSDDTALFHFQPRSVFFFFHFLWAVFNLFSRGLKEDSSIINGKYAIHGPQDSDIYTTVSSSEAL